METNNKEIEFKDPMDIILDKISDLQKIPMPTLILKTRKREVVFARQAYFWCSRTLLFHNKVIHVSVDSYQAIGDKVGKDHATVMHGIKTINNLIDTDRFIKMRMDFLLKETKLAILPKLPECKHDSIKKVKGTFFSCNNCNWTKFIPEETNNEIPEILEYHNAENHGG